MVYTFKHAILGGTFDHFHKGHANFLSMSFAQSEHLTLGIVAYSPKDKHLSDQLEDYPTRLAALTNYLSSCNLLARCLIIPLHDIYGTSLTDSSIEAIFVTSTTLPGAQAINVERKQQHLPPLKVILVPQDIGDDEEVISSSRIRAGLIDRVGSSYLKYLLAKPMYHLPDSLRADLQTPLGTVVTDIGGLQKVISPTSTIISVGDIVSIDLQKAGYTPVVSIVDYHTRRQSLDPNQLVKYFPTIHATLANEAGTINSQFAPLLVSALKDLQHPQIIKVDGEEDLLALPAILLSPLGSYLVYGQYQVGMCIVEITEELKTQVKDLLAQFS